MAETQETSDYPGALDSWVSLTDKEDLAEVSDINKIKAALLSTQTEMGVDPAGSLATVVARLAMIQNVDGAIQKGTAFPTTGLVDGQMFYRTDENILYIYNGSTWDGQSQVLSNILHSALDISWADAQLGTAGWEDIGKSFPWTYKAGINTLTFQMRVSNNTTGGDNFNIRVDIGGGTVVSNTLAVTASETSDVWRTAFTADVSGLTPGTVYTIKIQHDVESTPSTTTTITGFIIEGS